MSSKDKTYTLFKRYIWLLDIIYRHGRITFEKINELWQKSVLNENEEDLPLRTFHNHRESIEDMFDIIIDCDIKEGYKYYILDTDDLKKESIRNWLFNSFAVNNLMNESQKLKHRILFEQIPSGQRFLTLVLEAMQEDFTLNITYQSFKNDKPSSFEIEPYGLKVFKQRWYLLAKSKSDSILRIYSLDRIENMQITNKPFKIPSDFCPETYFENAFGISVVESIKPCTVEIMVFGIQRKYLQTLPLHHSQKEKEVTEDYTVFSYFLAPTFDFKQEILSHGKFIKVLKPRWFKEEVRETVRDMYQHYYIKNNS
jgi:hypothetical protein